MQLISDLKLIFLKGNRTHPDLTYFIGIFGQLYRSYSLDEGKTERIRDTQIQGTLDEFDLITLR